MPSYDRYFLVASRGLTASTWFSNALNQHPDIFCCHGRDRPSWTAGNRDNSSAVALKDSKYREDRMIFEIAQRTMDINVYLAILIASARGQKYLGNVHGFVLTELLDRLEKAGLSGCMATRPIWRFWRLI